MDIIGSKRADCPVPYTKEAYGRRGAGSIDSCSGVESVLLSRSTCLAGRGDDVGNDTGVGRHREIFRDGSSRQATKRTTLARQRSGNVHVARGLLTYNVKH